jgi:hypothetical protein
MAGNGECLFTVQKNSFPGATCSALQKLIEVAEEKPEKVPSYFFTKTRIPLAPKV